MKVSELLEAYGSVSDTFQPSPDVNIGQYLARVRTTKQTGLPDEWIGTLQFLIKCPNLTSWEGCPVRFVDESTSNVGGIMLHNTGISSLHGCYIEQATFVSLNNGLIKNLHNIHKHLGKVKAITCELSTNMLGLCLIEGLEYVFVRTANATFATSREEQLSKLLTKHLSTRDIHACQEELIEAGFIQQARL